jgi:hypothetical protein
MIAHTAHTGRSIVTAAVGGPVDRARNAAVVRRFTTATIGGNQIIRPFTAHERRGNLRQAGALCRGQINDVHPCHPP